MDHDFFWFLKNMLDNLDMFNDQENEGESLFLTTGQVGDLKDFLETIGIQGEVRKVEWGEELTTEK